MNPGYVARPLVMRVPDRTKTPSPEEQLAYWRGQLAGAPPRLTLAPDFARPSRKQTAGRRCVFELGPDRAAGVERLARETQTTTFTVLLAAWQLLLGRHAGQRDVVVGTKVGANVVALRARLDRAATFRSLLGSVHETTTAAAAHRDVPFERVAEALSPAVDPSHTPIFQVMFEHRARASGTKGDRQHVPDAPVEATFDLTLAVEADGAALHGALDYDAALFTRATASRLCARYDALLDAALARPDLPLDGLPITTAGERHDLLVTWNDTATGPLPTASVNALFARQVAATPDAVAVACGDETLRYGELAARAAHLAGRLRAAGVGPDVRVGVCVDPSTSMVVALLAVLRAGGASPK